jgi:flavodoxin
MKKLVVYYSLEGHTEKLAQAIADATGAEAVRVRPKDDVPDHGFSKYLKGGSQVMKKVKPDIRPLSVDPAEYDLIFIGCPVWAGGFVPALRTLFDQWELQGKKVALFVSHRGGKGQALERMAEALAGNKIVGQRDFVERADDYVESAGKWARDVLGGIGEE